jgi:hypothetical protein
LSEQFLYEKFSSPNISFAKNQKFSYLIFLQIKKNFFFGEKGYLCQPTRGANAVALRAVHACTGATTTPIQDAGCEKPSAQYSLGTAYLAVATALRWDQRRHNDRPVHVCIFFQKENSIFFEAIFRIV